MVRTNDLNCRRFAVAESNTSFGSAVPDVRRAAHRGPIGAEQLPEVPVLTLIFVGWLVHGCTAQKAGLRVLGGAGLGRWGTGLGHREKVRRDVLAGRDVLYADEAAPGARVVNAVADEVDPGPGRTRCRGRSSGPGRRSRPGCASPAAAAGRRGRRARNRTARGTRSRRRRAGRGADGRALRVESIRHASSGLRLASRSARQKWDARVIESDSANGRYGDRALPPGVGACRPGCRAGRRAGRTSPRRAR